ncbi:MAG: O-antigen ligase family protein [Clostridia bacterium]|nr:O-antigen ligase family protein [Clostridia bacterium]
MEARASRKRSAIDLIIIFIFLNSLGFPGNYTRVFGEWLGTVVDYCAFLLMIAVMFMTSANNVMDVVVLDLRRKYMSIYLLVVVLFVSSMLVSVSPSKQIITCVRFSVTVLFTLWLCNQFSLQSVLERVYYAQIIFVALTLVFVLIFPAYVYRESAAYAGDFVGLYSAKNGAGTELAFGVMVQVVLLRMYAQQKAPVSRLFIIFLGLQTVLLFLTHNTGSLFCLMVPVVYLLQLQPKWGVSGRLPLGWMYVVGSVGFLIFALTIIPLFEPLLNAIGKDATLTGRVPLWEAALELIMGNNTITGYGYAMFWRDEAAVDLLHSAFDEYSFMASQTSGAHNVIVEMLLNSGVLGVGVFFLTTLDSLKRIQELQENRYLWCSAFILFFMVYGLTERAFSTHEFMTMFLFFALGTACCREDDQPAEFQHQA